MTKSNGARAPRGQALAEFALILPIALLVLMGTIQFGLMLSAYVGATNVAREVARYGSVCLVKDAATASSCGSYTRSYVATVLPQRIQAGVPATDKITVCYDSYVAPKAVATDPDRLNVRQTVSIGIRYPLFVPLIGAIIDGIDGEPGDGRFLLLAKEAMRVEGSSFTGSPGSLGCY